MSCRSDGEGDTALPPPVFSTPTKADCNDGACHGEPDAKETDAESDSNVEENIHESTGNVA